MRPRRGRRSELHRAEPEPHQQRPGGRPEHLRHRPDTGYYEFTEAYPLGYNDVIQAFNTRFKTTGVTWQACNDPQEHTTITAAVDVQYNPVIAQCGRLDWAVQPYTGASAAQNDPNKPIDRADNGGIVATVLYDAVRNRYLGRTQMPVRLLHRHPRRPHRTVPTGQGTRSTPPRPSTCGTATAPNVSYNHYFLNCDGSYRTTGPHRRVTPPPTATARSPAPTATADAPPSGTVNAYQSPSTTRRATGCVARDANGKIISGTRRRDGEGDGYAVQRQHRDRLPARSDRSTPRARTRATTRRPASRRRRRRSISAWAPTTCRWTRTSPTAPTHGSQTVDGNFALTPTDAAGNPAVGDFLAKVDIPGDTVLPQVSPGVDRPLYKVADETSMNNFAGANLGRLHRRPGRSRQHAAVRAAERRPDRRSTTPTAASTRSARPARRAAAGLRGVQLPAAGRRRRRQTPIAAPVTGGDSPTSLVEDPNTASPSPDPQCAGSQPTP